MSRTRISSHAVTIRSVTFSITTALGLGALPTQAQSSDGDLLRFRNGDSLRGSLVEIDVKDDRLVWASPAAPERLTFRLGPAAQIETAGGARPPQGSRATVRMTNGDEWTGRLVRMDTEHLEMESWAAGTIRLETPLVTAVMPRTTANQVHLTGPGDKRAWRFRSVGNTGRWDIRDDRLEIVGQAFVGRNIGNLRQHGLRLACTVDWVQYPNLGIFFYADTQDNNPRNGYSFQIMGNNLFLNRIRDGNVQRMGQQMQARQGGETRAEIEIWVNRDDAEFLVRVNGQEVFRAKDPQGFNGRGDGLIFFAGHNVPHTFAGLNVEAWTGSLPDGSEPTVPADQDVVVFSNGDRLAGKLVGIAAGTARITTAFADLDVPLERISSIQLAAQSRRVPRANPTATRVVLADQGKVTLDLVSVGAAGLQGTVAGVGPVTIRRDALARLELPERK